jgi:hypothetical protein
MVRVRNYATQRRKSQPLRLRREVESPPLFKRNRESMDMGEDH